MNEELTWLDDGERRFIARCPLPRPPADSSIVRLIQGVWEHEPAQARRILRRRLRTSARELDEMDWGMLKVAAKRVDPGIDPFSDPMDPARLLVELPALQALPSVAASEVPGREAPHAAWMSLALKLASAVEIRGERFLSNRKIAALLVSRGGELLGASTHSGSSNRTRHAEVNLVQAYCRARGERLPEGTRLYATLKPCKMCAGMLWEAATDPATLRVYYSEDDPGPMGSRTVFNPGCVEHERACLKRPAYAGARVELRL